VTDGSRSTGLAQMHCVATPDERRRSALPSNTRRTIRSLVTAFSPGASRVWHNRLNNAVEPAVTNTCLRCHLVMRSEFAPQLAAIVVRIKIRRANRGPHGIDGARRRSKGIFVGIESNEP